MPAVWNPQANAIFLQVLEQPPAEREAFLQQACGGDSALAAQVRSLLAAGEQAGSFLDSPAIDALPAFDQPLAGPGTQIGPYKLIEQIGEGGMGTVWMAQQSGPVKRLVAVKLIKAGMDSRQVIARFEAERQALALMDHPNIARVLDGGSTSAGRPYFVMDLVRGTPITRYCDEHHLTPRQRLELFIPVCQALQHAHQKGIINRDLKPTNVLAALYDGRPVPKIIDFGVAKAAGQPLTERTLVTGFGAIVGTLEYMSPEQAEFNQLDIDTRSDIYSLGVLLYELLTGTTPLERKRIKQSGMLEALRIIREEDVPTLSNRLSATEELPAIAANRGTEPAKLTRLMHGELDWIVMKALEKDRNRRYDTANSFALDLQRYLADEPVLACPPSAGYRVRKFARRNRFGLALAGVVLLSLLLLGGGAGWAWRDWAAREADRANHLERAVDRAESLQREGKRGEALAALDQARLLAREAEPAPSIAKRIESLQEALDDEARDEAFVARFDAIRLEVQTEVDVENSRYRQADAYPRLREALGQYGLAIGDTPTAAAVTAIRKRPPAIQTIVIAALDECFYRAPADDSHMRRWLMDVLQKADRDPWRNQVRRVWTQPAKLEALVKDIDARRQPPSFLLIAVAALPMGSPARLDLARRIQSARPSDFWANTWLGDELLRAGGHGEAIRYYTAALALRPDNPGVLCCRGGCLNSAGDRKAALADLERALALAPRLAPAHVNLGIMLLDQQRIDEAIARFQASIEFDPKLTMAYQSLAQAYAATGQWSQVAAELNRALERDANDHETWRSAAYAHLAAGDAEGYRRICRQTLERFGATDSPVIAQRAAMTLSLLPDAVPDIGPVERLAERAVTGTENHGYYRYFALAKALTEGRAGRPAEVVTWMERFAPRTDGELWDATGFAALAMAQHRLGRGEEANASLAKAKAIVSQRMPDPAKGQLFGANWLDGVHAQAVAREAEELLNKQVECQETMKSNSSVNPAEHQTPCPRNHQESEKKPN